MAHAQERKKQIRHSVNKLKRCIKDYQDLAHESAQSIAQKHKELLSHFDEVDFREQMSEHLDSIEQTLKVLLDELMQIRIDFDAFQTPLNHLCDNLEESKKLD